MMLTSKYGVRRVLRTGIRGNRVGWGRAEKSALWIAFYNSKVQVETIDTPANVRHSTAFFENDEYITREPIPAHHSCNFAYIPS